MQNIQLVQNAPNKHQCLMEEYVQDALKEHILINKIKYVSLVMVVKLLLEQNRVMCVNALSWNHSLTKLNANHATCLVIGTKPLWLVNIVQIKQYIVDKLVDAPSAHKQPQYSKITDVTPVLKEPNIALRKINASKLVLMK